jgi:hypothetical protein
VQTVPQCTRSSHGRRTKAEVPLMNFGSVYVSTAGARRSARRSTGHRASGFNGRLTLIGEEGRLVVNLAREVCGCEELSIHQVRAHDLRQLRRRQILQLLLDFLRAGPDGMHQRSRSGAQKQLPPPELLPPSVSSAGGHLLRRVG